MSRWRDGGHGGEIEEDRVCDNGSWGREETRWRLVDSRLPWVASQFGEEKSFTMVECNGTRKGRGKAMIFLHATFLFDQKIVLIFPFFFTTPPFFSCAVLPPHSPR